MATLQVRDIDDRLYEYLKTSARVQNRSISQEVVSIIEAHLNSVGRQQGNATAEFLSLAGSWKDDRPADEILADLRSSRNRSGRFGDDVGLFD